VSGAGAQVLAQAATCNNNADSTTTFQVTADPMTVGTTGVRHFYSNQTGTIWQDSVNDFSAINNASDPVVGGSLTVLQ
jgi:hypothetical protein